MVDGVLGEPRVSVRLHVAVVHRHEGVHVPIHDHNMMALTVLAIKPRLSHAQEVLQLTVQSVSLYIFFLYLCKVYITLSIIPVSWYRLSCWSSLFVSTHTVYISNSLCVTKTQGLLYFRCSHES